MNILMWVHIAAGLLALPAGAAAVAARKGGRLHARAGTLFFGAMLVLGVSAAILEPFREPEPGSPIVGLFVCYFVATSWVAARRRDGVTGKFEMFACAAALGTAAFMIWGVAMDGATTPAGPGVIYALASICLLAGLLDLSAILRKRLTPAQRIARHLWRMCFAFFIATGSFFLGQQDVMPEALRGSPSLLVLAFAPFGVMAFWLGLMQALQQAGITQQLAISELYKLTKDMDPVITVGVGQHQMWAAHYVGYEKPKTWINSGGLGTMGFAVPGAMGAKVGMPDSTVWAIDGDGCFQMTNQELATCAIEGIPIKVAIINNSSLGMVRQWQTLFYNERYSNTDLQRVEEVRIPDFVKLAEAYGCVGLACDSPDDVDATIQKAMEINDVPVVIDFRVHRDAMVWPMVAAGTSNDDIKFARDMAPEFEEDDL